MSSVALLQNYLPSDVAEIVSSYWSFFPFHHADQSDVLKDFVSEFWAPYVQSKRMGNYVRASKCATRFFEILLVYSKLLTDEERLLWLGRLVEASTDLRGKAYFFYDRLSIDGVNPLKYPGPNVAFDFEFANTLDNINATIKNRTKAFRKCLLALIYKCRYQSDWVSLMQILFLKREIITCGLWSDCTIMNWVHSPTPASTCSVRKLDSPLLPIDADFNEGQFTSIDRDIDVLGMMNLYESHFKD